MSFSSNSVFRIYIQYVFSMHFAQLLHSSIRIRAVDRMTTRMTRCTKSMQQTDKKYARVIKYPLIHIRGVR